MVNWLATSTYNFLLNLTYEGIAWYRFGKVIYVLITLFSKRNNPGNLSLHAKITSDEFAIKTYLKASIALGFRHKHRQ